jgi:uncharacterized protein (TIGR02001 family)
MHPRLLAVTALIVVAPGFALAQSAPELSYGVALTSNYIDQGVTQSDDKPAIQGYGEVAVGLFYGGVWASTVDFGEGTEDNVEFDLYAGIRPSFGDLSLDLNYTRFIYDDTGDYGGEFALIATHPLSDIGEVAGAIYYGQPPEEEGDPDDQYTWGEIAMAFPFAEVWSAGGTIGADFGTHDLPDGDKYAWDLGVSRYIGDYVTLDVRYYDSNYDEDTFVASIAADF